MTVISTVYDAWVTKIEATLTDYKRIPDPYDPEKNNSLLLNKGYGLGFGTASNLELQATPKISIAREFFVVLTNKITTTEGNATARGTIEKNLLEDHFLLIKAIEADPTLGGACTVSKYVSDGGVEFVSAARAKHFLIEIVFESTYFESSL